MKHFFVINPAAGKGVESSQIIGSIKEACSAADVQYEIYLTTARGDGKSFVRKKIAEKPSSEIWRFYACGGDGTLSEVVNGAINTDSKQNPGPIPGVEVGCIPIGTGNDFVRNFTSQECFRDVKKQICAEAIEIDGYSCGDGKYGINMINIGFDCDVAAKASEYKTRKILPKSLAYIAGVVVMLRKNLGRVIHVTRDDGSEITKEFQLVSAANGGWCGGGFNSAPKCSLNDGLLDISLIDKVTRRDFIKLVGSYKAGKHLETKLGQRIVEYKQSRAVTFEFTEPTNVCIDGEILKTEKLEISVMPRALAFAVPKGCKYGKLL